MPESCELCKLEPLTEWLWEGDVCRIVRCVTCGGWMLVFRKHGWPTVEEMLIALGVVSAKFGNVLIRTNHKRIQNHPHWHILAEEA